MLPARAALVALIISAAGCSWGGGSATARATPLPGADPARPLPSPLPEIVARVDGSPISMQQVLPLAKAALDRVSASERDSKLPEVLRASVDKYVERELLLQEALRRGISADAEGVDWAYDQLHREHPDEAAWAGFLHDQGTDPQSLKGELRIRHTIAALVEDELRSLKLSDEEKRVRGPQVLAALVARLRAKARIELLL